MKQKTLFVSLLVLGLMMGMVSIAGAQELVLWHTSFVNEWSGLDEVVNFFEENTKLDVSQDYGPSLYREQSQKLIIQARTGNPDVIEGVLEQMFTYAKADLIMPLDKFFAEYEDKDQYVKNAIDALKINGKLYGIPYNTNVRLLLYRKDIFEKYDLEVPKTWDELVNTAAYITQNVPDMQGFMFTTKSREVRAFQEFMSFYFQLNKHMFEVNGEEVKVVATPEQLSQVLDLYYRLFFEGGIDLNERGADWKALDYGYTAGKYAMVTVGPWIWSHRFEDEARGKVLDNTGIAAIPVAANGTPGTYMEVKPIMVNKYTDQPQKAWELVKEVTSKDFQLLIDSLAGVLSPRQDVMAEDKMANNWWLSGFAKYMDTGIALDPVSWEKPQNAIIQSIQKVIYKQMTPEEAGQWLYDQLVDIAETL